VKTDEIYVNTFHTPENAPTAQVGKTGLLVFFSYQLTRIGLTNRPTILELCRSSLLLLPRAGRRPVPDRRINAGQVIAAPFIINPPSLDMNPPSLDTDPPSLDMNPRLCSTFAPTDVQLLLISYLLPLGLRSILHTSSALVLPPNPQQ